MKKALGIAVGALVAAVAVPSLAQAQTAYTTTYVNLRTGPGFEYPIVLAVPAQAPLDTYGCLNDWSWCDVSFNGYRGWMAGDYIAYVRDDRWIPVYDYGPRYSIPIITFSFGTYWDTYYRDRPWYRDRDRWSRYDRDHHDDHRPPQHRDMPRTLPRADTGHTGVIPNDGKGDRGVQHITPPPKVQPGKVAPTKIAPPKAPPKTPEAHGPVNKGNDGKGGKGKDDQQDQDNNQKH
jgi:uncharacterized protein YraI